MKFLVDAQLPQGLAAWLRSKGHEALHVADLGMMESPDVEIALYVARCGLIMVSKDSDFANLRLPDRFVFVWLQCGNIRNRALLAWLDPQWSDIEAALLAGDRLVEVR